MKQAVLASDGLSAGERQAVESTRTVFEFDDRFIAPRDDFRDALDYYGRSAEARLLARISVPTLMLHARNDPWIPVRPYVEPEGAVSTSVTMKVAQSGGHVGAIWPRRRPLGLGCIDCPDPASPMSVLASSLLLEDKACLRSPVRLLRRGPGPRQTSSVQPSAIMMSALVMSERVAGAVPVSISFTEVFNTLEADSEGASQLTHKRLRTGAQHYCGR